MSCSLIPRTDSVYDSIALVLWSLRHKSLFLWSPAVETVQLTPFSRLVEIRAAQRTFEGAYIRTALGQFSFALIVLKIFTKEFYSIGALFATYGAGILMVSVYRRYEGNRQFFSEVGDDGMGRKKFRTSGNAVVVLTALSMVAYATLIVLTVRLVDDEWRVLGLNVRRVSIGGFIRKSNMLLAACRIWGLKIGGHGIHN